jgi:hypothetical protein
VTWHVKAWIILCATTEHREQSSFRYAESHICEIFPVFDVCLILVVGEPDVPDYGKHRYYHLLNALEPGDVSFQRITSLIQKFKYS